MYNAADYPHLAGNSDNIQFLFGHANKKGTQHNRAHNGWSGNSTNYYFDPQADAKLYFDDSANIHAPIIELTRVDVNGVSTVNSNLNARFEEIFPGFSSLTDDEKTLVQKASQSWNPDVDGDFIDYIVIFIANALP